jgi:hypothetical protein
MNERTTELAKLARQLYQRHKKVLDFIIEHGVGTDFATAARTLFGNNPKRGTGEMIGKGAYVFATLF